MHLTNANIEEYLVKTNFQKRIDKLAEKYKNKKIMIYGASVAFDIIKRKFDLSRFNIIGIADQKFNDGAKYAGYLTYTPYTFFKKNPDIVLIAMIESEVAKCFFEDVLIPEFGCFEYENLISKESFVQNIKLFFRKFVNDFKYCILTGKNKVSLPKPKIYPDAKTYIEENSKVDIRYKMIIPETEESKECFVLNIPHGKIWGNDSIVLTHDNSMIINLVVYMGTDLSKHPIFNKEMFSRISNKNYYAENIGVLASIWSNCYYHWVIDVLPKLFLLEKSGITIHKYVVSNYINDFQREYLKLLNIPENKIITIDNKTLVHSKNLIVPAIPNALGNCPLWACDFLKEKMAKHVNKNKSYPERIFISRSKSTIRRIINEDEIFKILEQKGFVKVFPEELDLREQISIFYNTKAIVAPHGAGLTNLVFSDSSIKVLEFFTQNNLNGCYTNICRNKGIDYHSLICKDTFDKNYDIMVDEKEFVEKLELMGL